MDIHAQMSSASGHAVNPVPITEAKRIPTAEEVINAQIFCGTLIAKSTNYYEMLDTRQADEQANRLIEGVKPLKNNVFNVLSHIGIDVTDALELLLSLRRIEIKTL